MQLPMKRDDIVQGYLFDTVSEELSPRNNTVCKIVGRAQTDEVMEFGPAFQVQFGDGTQVVAYASELSPWYAID